MNEIIWSAFEIVVVFSSVIGIVIYGEHREWWML